MKGDSITVHVLSRVVSCQVEPSEADYYVAKEDATFLSRGRAIAHVGCGRNGWQVPKAGETRDCLFKNAFTYLPAPPPVPTATAAAHTSESGIVKEWGTRPSESEKFYTTDLDPFESMLFCSLHSCPPVGDPTVPKGHCDRRWSLGSSSPSPSRPPTKRVKVVEVDTGPLDELIPLPHYVPAPLESSSGPALPPAPLDGRTSFVPILPQTASSIEALFSSAYARVAWLIPVRGLPPWDGVSRASLALPLPGPTGNRTSISTDSSNVAWTHSSFRQFWAFLRSRSEITSSEMGPLSLSFHAAPQLDHMGSQGGIVSPAAFESAYLHVNRETEMTPSDPPSLAPIAIASKSRLTDIDYVKVYCDAPRAMWVRRTLSQWEYKESGHTEDPGGCVAAIRILEFAKMVLVDERGEGVLVS